MTIKELMEEGKNLSKQNAKQSKELKRLREIEKQYEAQVMKLNEANEEIEVTPKENSCHFQLNFRGSLNWRGN